MDTSTIRRRRWGRANPDSYSLGRWALLPGHALPPHRHDFFEVFWVEGGVGEHLVNDLVQPLRVGDCVFVRPDDVHGFRNPAIEALTWMNLAFPRRFHQALARRYRPHLPGWPWEGDAAPAIRRLSPRAIDGLKERAAAMPLRGASRLDLDWLLLDLLRQLWPGGRPAVRGSAPAWLLRTIEQFTELGLYQDGAPALIALSGRCANHVNRVIRAHLDLTTTDLVRHLRLEHAARELRLTHREILDIAFDAGFGSLGYFYRCFRRAFGTTPQRFRRGVMATG